MNEMEMFEFLEIINTIKEIDSERKSKK